MSRDPDQEYFSDGITEDIITDLSKASGLFVIARNSAFVYKGKTFSVPQVCRELGVKFALEGSIRRAGNRVRVTAQLIDGLSGRDQDGNAILFYVMVSSTPSDTTTSLTPSSVCSEFEGGIEARQVLTPVRDGAAAFCGSFPLRAS